MDSDLGSISDGLIGVLLKSVHGATDSGVLKDGYADAGTDA